MDSIDIEVIKKEIISKVAKLGEDYTTFSYANKFDSKPQHRKEFKLSHTYI